MRIQNTWLGDPARLAMLEAVINTIERDNLLERTKEAGAALMKGIYNLAVKMILTFYQYNSIRGILSN